MSSQQKQKKMMRKIVTRTYYFTQKELKERLGMEGGIQKICLSSGKNQWQEADDPSLETNEWAIETRNEE